MVSIPKPNQKQIILKRKGECKMAKNYTFSETVELIAKGDMEAIQDIGRRFPVLAAKVATVSALAGESFVDLASYMPDYLTANKVNRGMRDALAEIEENDEEENDDVEETKTTKSKAKAKVEETEDEEVDYSKMTAKELWDILGEAGKRNTAKSKKKADLVAAVEAMANTEEAEEGDTDEEETDNPYEGKSAMDLFKECKKRGIKAAAKKPAKFYADLLLKADAEDEGAEEEEEGDDWDAEEEETQKKKPAAKSKAKAKKEVEEDDEDEDEDDDWDI